MKLDTLASIAELCRQHAYAESSRYGEAQATNHHYGFIDRAWKDVVRPLAKLELSDWALDIGAGDGYTLDLLARKGGLLVEGINILDADIDACRERGYECRKVDMHDLPAEWTSKFSLAWGRHVFEHSPFPMLALAEAYRVLRPGGWIYIETPAPLTACLHETNFSHFSVFSEPMWTQLLLRSGFDVLHQDELHFNTLAGDDIYYRWLAQKPVPGEKL